MNKLVEEGALSPNWLNGKYENVCGYNVNIDYPLSFACFESVEDENNVYCFQGNEGDECIENIAAIYNVGDCTQEEAIKKYISLYLG